MQSCGHATWTCHTHFVRSRDTPVQSRGSIQGLGLGGLDDMRDMACLTSDIDGWRMFFMWDACASRGSRCRGDACSDLTSLLYLTGDLTAGVGKMGEVAGSGGIVSSSLLALAEARVH